MKLYHVQFDSQSYWIEAENFGTAVALWGRHVAKDWGPEYEGTEEPDSVHLVHDGPVIR